jgi:hypothetical protein
MSVLKNWGVQRRSYATIRRRPTVFICRWRGRGRHLRSAPRVTRYRPSPSPAMSRCTDVGLRLRLEQPKGAHQVGAAPQPTLLRSRRSSSGTGSPALGRRARRAPIAGLDALATRSGVAGRPDVRREEVEVGYVHLGVRRSHEPQPDPGSCSGSCRCEWSRPAAVGRPWWVPIPAARRRSRSLPDPHPLKSTQAFRRRRVVALPADEIGLQVARWLQSAHSALYAELDPRLSQDEESAYRRGRERTWCRCSRG